MEQVKENQLAVIVQQAGLETTKAQRILEEFQGYFELASEWETKAKAIIVTDEKQVAEMKMARTGRLFLRDKRIAIENTRKDLKEQALREGKAIDGIANVLKALIVPVEEYLEKQEKFIEIRDFRVAEARRIEGERLLAEQEVLKAKQFAEEQERIRLENEKLKQEAIAREKKMAEERAKQAKVLAEQQAKADAEKKAIEDANRKEREAAEAKAKAERDAIEAKAKIERDKQAKILAEQKAKAKEAADAAEMVRQKELAIAAKAKAEADAKARKLQAEALAQKKEAERLAEQLKNQIECPYCHKKFNR